MDTRTSTYEYRNKFIFNQRGGTVEINNSSDREEVKISQYSGSNIAINNNVTSELATNNKQTNVIHDEFHTVGNNHSIYIGGDRTVRCVENNYEILGGEFSPLEVSVHYLWQKAIRKVHDRNSWFNIARGGISQPGFIRIPRIGVRARNIDFKFSGFANTQYTFKGYTTYYPHVKVADSGSEWDNQVTSYETLKDKKVRQPILVGPTASNLRQAFGKCGTNAPGFLKYGVFNRTAATEGGTWLNLKKQKHDQILTWLDELYKPEPDGGDSALFAETDAGERLREKLLLLETRMGPGGDTVKVIKRHKVEQIGIMSNDFPSIRIDPEGRHNPTEIGVSENRVFLHYDYVPHVEDVSNESNFPCGNYTLNVGNKYNILVGSGGYNLNTTGKISLNSQHLTISTPRLDINTSHGIVMGSATHIDLYAPKIHLRSKSQILLESSVGVLNNLIIGGGAFVEGELYVNHITAPVEVQETNWTGVWGTIPWDLSKVAGWAYCDPRLFIGIATIYDCCPGSAGGQRIYQTAVYGSGAYMKVFGSGIHNTVMTYDHSHHFHNLPLRLIDSNKGVRNYASYEAINYATYPVRSQPVRNEKKYEYRDPKPPRCV